MTMRAARAHLDAPLLSPHKAPCRQSAQPFGAPLGGVPRARDRGV